MLGGFLALVVIEVELRVTGWRSATHFIYRKNFRLSANPLLKYELVPGSSDLGEHINSVGMRDREFPLEKSTDVFRIAVVGDSVTFGYGCSRAGSYAKQLEKLLNDHYECTKNFEVLNFGVTGYSIEQAVESARSNALPFQPDLILYGYVLNDPLADSVEWRALRQMAKEAKQSWSQRISTALAQTLGESKVFQLGYQYTVESPSQPKQLADPIFTAFDLETHDGYIRQIHNHDRTWSFTQQGFEQLATILQPHRLPCLVVVFPIVEVEKNEPYSLADVHHKVMVEAQRHGLDVYDLAPVFHQASQASSRSLFLDMMHPTPQGHRVAALALYIHLSEAGLLPEGVINHTKGMLGDEFDADIFEALSAKPAIE